MTTSQTGEHRGRRWLERRWQDLRRNPEASVTFGVAVILGALAVAGVITDAAQLTGATLAAIALIAFSLIADERRREAAKTDVQHVALTTARIEQQVERLDDRVARSGSLVEVPPGQPITDLFEEAVLSTTLWRFKGGTGSFLRAWTLPMLAEVARRNAGARFPITIDLLHPGDPVCEDYSEYRRKLAMHRSIDPQSHWTPDLVRVEAASTILAAAWFYQHEFLDPKVTLARSLSVLRYDISSGFAILTNEDKRFPALLARTSSPLYSAFVSELDQRARRDSIDVSAAPKLPAEMDAITSDTAVTVLSHLGIDMGGVEPSALADLPALAFHRTNPYKP